MANAGPVPSTPGPATEDRSRPTVSAVILAHNRRDAIATVLDRLRGEPIDEVIIVDSGSSDGTPDVARAHDSKPVVIEAGANVAIAGRNMGARAASSEFLLILDDDAYPLPGAVDALLAAFRDNPRLAIAGGFVRDVDGAGGPVVRQHEVGTFDWWLRGGRRLGTPTPPEGWPCIFFPEGACLVRRSAFFEVGGFFEPYWFGSSEVDLSTRLFAKGWDVRYFPTAVFDHMKEQSGRIHGGPTRRLRVRNQIWYFALRFPATMAIRRVPAYLLWDLIECAWAHALRDWVGGIRAAWTERAAVRGMREPLPREVLRRAELNRGRLHMRLLVLQAGRKSRLLR